MNDAEARTRERIEELRMEISQLKRSLLSMRPANRLPLEALVTRVGDVALAVPVVQVEEVVPMVLVSPLPRAPAPVRGMVNFHGRLIPVLDLHRPLLERQVPLTPGMFLVVLSVDPHAFALPVDEIEGVDELGEEERGTETASRSAPAFVHRILLGDGQPVLLLDPLGLMTAAEIDLLSGVLAEANRANRRDGG
jgi:chemotaxis signal transduction protein